MRSVNPFSPDWEFEEAVLNLNQNHIPGSVVAGKTRNVLVRAWALVAGKARAKRELLLAIQRHGSRAALASALQMSRGTLREFEEFVESLSERYSLPQSGPEFRNALFSRFHGAGGL